MNPDDYLAANSLKHIRHIVGICGPLGSGKTAVALKLRESHKFTRTRFADRLKKMLKAFGLSWENLDGDQKNSELPILGGKTPRWAMQTLGTEWGRDRIHPDVWVFAWKQELVDLHFQCNYKTYDIVTDDLRFPNEAAAIREMGGTILRVLRPGHQHNLGHESEAHVLDADLVIHNDGSLEDLYAKVDELHASLVTSPQDG